MIYPPVRQAGPSGRADLTIVYVLVGTHLSSGTFHRFSLMPTWLGKYECVQHHLQATGCYNYPGQEWTKHICHSGPGQWVTCPIHYLFWILWSPEDYQSLGIFLRFQDWENLFYFLLVIDKIRGTGRGLRWSKHLNKNDILTPWPGSHSPATVTKCLLHDGTVSNKGHLNWKLCGSIDFLMCFIPHHRAQYCAVNTSYVKLWQSDRHSATAFCFHDFFNFGGTRQSSILNLFTKRTVYVACNFLDWGWLATVYPVSAMSFDFWFDRSTVVKGKIIRFKISYIWWLGIKLRGVLGGAKQT